MELEDRGKGKENDRASVISHTRRCKCRTFIKNCGKMGKSGKGVRENILTD
jgi:hypothetical protein